jgi:hypothetical protein
MSAKTAYWISIVLGALALALAAANMYLNEGNHARQD